MAGTLIKSHSVRSAQYGSPRSARQSFTGERGIGLAAGWALIHEARDALAALADSGREPLPLSPREFAMRAAAAGPARLAAAERALDDCAATLHIGLTALIGAQEKGQECAVVALTLRREFERARAGLLSLTAPPNR